jgi:hypothetical protein
MDSLQDIISRYDKPEQPELAAVKGYVDEHYHIPISAAISGDTIVVTVPSAALANTLRLQSSKITEVCKLDKRLVFRIG